MASPAGIFSFPTLEAFMRLGQHPSSVIKRAAILFDRLVFHPQGTMINMPFAGDTSKHGFLSSILATSEQEQAFLRSEPAFDKIFLLTDDLVDDAETLYYSVSDAVRDNETWRAASHNVASDIILTALGIESPREDYENWYEGMKRLPYQLAEDLAVFEVTALIPGSAGLFSDLHGQVAIAARDQIPTSAKTVGLVQEFKEMEIADFAELSWARILELRRDGFLSDFRQKLSGVAEQQQHGEPVRAAALLQDLWGLVREVEPQLGKTYLSAILGNIPTPFLFNPASVASAVNDVEQAHRLQKDYGWIFFVSKAQRVSSSSMHNKRV